MKDNIFDEFAAIKYDPEMGTDIAECPHCGAQLQCDVETECPVCGESLKK